MASREYSRRVESALTSGKAFLEKAKGAYSGRLTGGAAFMAATTSSEVSDASSDFGRGLRRSARMWTSDQAVVIAGLIVLGSALMPSSFSSLSICLIPAFEVSDGGACWVSPHNPSALEPSCFTTS